MLNGPNTVEVKTRALLPNLLITEKKFESEKSLLVICKVWSLFVNTLVTDEKYSFLYRNNLMQPIHMELSEREKSFFLIYFELLKSILNLEHLEKKDEPHAWRISEIRDSKKRGLGTPKNVVR